MEKKPKSKKIRLWWKNMGRSINEIWQDAVKDIPGVALADGTITTVKDAAKRGKKGKLLKDIDKLNAKTAYSLRKFLKEQLQEDLLPAYDNLKAAKKEVVGRVKSGSLLRNNNRRETGRRNKENNDLLDLMDRLDSIEDFEFDDESYSENYMVGGEMLKNKLHEKVKELKIQTHAESLNVLSNLSGLNEVISELATDIENKVYFCESLENNEINDTIIKDNTDEIRERTLVIAQAISKEPAVANNYSKVVGTAIAIATDLEANYVVEAPTDDNIEELLAKIDADKTKLDEVSPMASRHYSHLVEETEETLQDTVEDIVYEPVEVEDANVVAAAERSIKSAKAEDFTGIGTMINAVMMVPALITNTFIDRNNRKFAARYGTTATIKQPVLTTNTLSRETVKSLCKALEVKYALQLKATLESTVSAMDGGLVSKRLRTANIASPGKLDVKDAKLYAANPLSYDQLVGVFSEGHIKTDYLGYTNTDTLHIIPSSLSLFRRNMTDLELAYLNEAATSRGEAGIELEERRTALPTYLTVNIRYDAPKSMVSFERQNVSNETVVGIALNPKVVSAKEFVEVIRDNKFSKIKVDKDERTFAKRFGSILKFWRTKKASTPQGKVLNTSSMKNIIDKVSNIKTPLFHVMLSDSDYVVLKNNGIDLKSEQDYKELMNALPIISITIVNEDNGIVLHSDSKAMGYIKKNISDFVDSTAELEKQLRSEIKFRHNL